MALAKRATAKTPAPRRPAPFVVPQNLHVLGHPLISHKLTLMRDVKTTTLSFRQLLREISLLMGYEITRTLPQTTRTIQTPITTMKAPVLAGPAPVIIPILRAGLGMAEGLHELIPDAVMGHIGIYRHAKTHAPVEYLVKLPDDLKKPTIFMVDPMLATGHTAIHAIHLLKKRGVKEKQIHFMALVSAPEGVAALLKAHPGIQVYTAALDSHLNEKAYIVPGLGDAGDRLFGTA